MAEFVGLNVHYPFRPDLYRPVTGNVRNYHDMNWDVENPGDPPTFPRCVNGVNWDEVYGRWAAEGHAISLCSQFVKFGRQHPDHRELWKNKTGWTREYGRAMATHFGPTNGNGLVTSIEIGNEPGSEFDDVIYREIFREMAGGIREADPAIKIATCTVHARPADTYHKSLDETFGDTELLPLFDVISVHSYAGLPEGDRQHPWERTFPEDPRSDFLRTIDEVVAWREANAADKEIWVTEFGWDACTEDAMQRRTGWFKKLSWTGVSELEQAQFLIRSLLLLAARPIERAYIFWFNDQDEPSVHGASGITRDFQPKVSFHALAQFQSILGDFRFAKILTARDGKWVYLFQADDGRQVAAAWKSTDAPQFLDSTDLPYGTSVAAVFPMQTGESDVQPLAGSENPELSGSVTYFVLQSRKLPEAKN